MVTTPSSSTSVTPTVTSRVADRPPSSVALTVTMWVVDTLSKLGGVEKYSSPRLEIQKSSVA